MAKSSGIRKEPMCQSTNLSKPRVKPVPAGYLGGQVQKLGSEHAEFRQEAQALGQGYAEYEGASPSKSTGKYPGQK